MFSVRKHSSLLPRRVHNRSKNAHTLGIFIVLKSKATWKNFGRGSKRFPVENTLAYFQEEFTTDQKIHTH
jgi:hypothetical protein